MAKAKRRKKRVTKKRTAKASKRVRRVKRRPRRAATPVTSVVGNLTRAHQELSAQRDALDQQITMIEQALAAMSAKPAARAGRRPGRGRAAGGRRKGSLKDYIAKVLSARRGAMAVKDITAAVRRAGYKTKNKTLAKSVGIALTQMPEITKVGRGTFQQR